ncbi:MAG: IS630 family transposase, partial [Terriglobia bacterium]
KIDQFVRSSNTQAQPFVWTATADSILAKIERLCNRISGTAH